MFRMGLQEQEEAVRHSFNGGIDGSPFQRSL